MWRLLARSDDRWTRWHWEIIGHLAYAAVAGVMMLLPLPLWIAIWDARHINLFRLPAVLLICLPLAGLMLPVNALVYQWARWPRHNDTPKRDVLHYVIGFAVGVGATGIAGLVLAL